MTGEQQELIWYRLQRAHETLEEAGILIKAGKFQGVANRVYYAMY